MAKLYCIDYCSFLSTLQFITDGKQNITVCRNTIRKVFDSDKAI
jgi:hypothetical protein